MWDVVRDCEFMDYTFGVTRDARGAIYLQGVYSEDDVVTGKPDTQMTRRWFLSPQMTESEIVQTVFKCALTSMEHRTREHFKWRGRAIFGPHFKVSDLWKVCGVAQDTREK